MSKIVSYKNCTGKIIIESKIKDKSNIELDKVIVNLGVHIWDVSRHSERERERESINCSECQHEQIVCFIKNKGILTLT
jgi:hypothetical protein